MTDIEKSTRLADLMNWKVHTGRYVYIVDNCIRSLCPYSNSESGLAQFSAILLAYPDIMVNFCHIEQEIDEQGEYIQFDYKNATQENILDEIVRVHCSGSY